MWGDCCLRCPSSQRKLGSLAESSADQMKGGWVYIMTNKRNGVLYIGVTADIASRLHQHRTGGGSAFCRRYGLDKCVHAEEFESIDEAIAREKALKAWKRAWKIELIEQTNPGWHDLVGGVA